MDGMDVGIGGQGQAQKQTRRRRKAQPRLQDGTAPVRASGPRGNLKFSPLLTPSWLGQNWGPGGNEKGGGPEYHLRHLNPPIPQVGP